MKRKIAALLVFLMVFSFAPFSVNAAQPVNYYAYMDATEFVQSTAIWNSVQTGNPINWNDVNAMIQNAYNADLLATGSPTQLPGTPTQLATPTQLNSALFESMKAANGQTPFFKPSGNNESDYAAWFDAYESVNLVNYTTLLTTNMLPFTHGDGSPVYTTTEGINIHRQPASGSYSVGTTATFSVDASSYGGTPLSYQWQIKEPGSAVFRDFTIADYLARDPDMPSTVSYARADGKDAVLDIPDVSLAINGTKYRVVITANTGDAATSASAISDEATLTVTSHPEGINIHRQPASGSYYVGTTATFSVDASSSGGTPLSYQWQLKEPGSADFRDFTIADYLARDPESSDTVTTAADGKDAVLNVPYVSLAVSGTKYRVIITANTGDAATSASAISDEATLTVTYRPIITTPTPGGSGGGSSSSSDDSDSRDYSSYYSGGGGGSSSSRTSTASATDSTPKAVTVSNAREVGRKAAEAARQSNGTTAYPRFKNPTKMTVDACEALSKATGMATKICADNMSSDGKSVDVRIMLDPSKVSKDIELSASTTSKRAISIKNYFEKYFQNEVTVIAMAQKTSFGQEVELCVKLGDADTFYTYSNGKYTQIQPQNVWKDKNGYTHIVGDIAGDIIATKGELK